VDSQVTNSLGVSKVSVDILGSVRSYLLRLLYGLPCNTDLREDFLDILFTIF